MTNPSAAGGDRRKRGKTDRRSTELTMVIRETLKELILVELLPRSQIDVYVQVRRPLEARPPASFAALRCRNRTS